MGGQIVRNWCESAMGRIACGFRPWLWSVGCVWLSRYGCAGLYNFTEGESSLEPRMYADTGLQNTSTVSVVHVLPRLFTFNGMENGDWNPRMCLSVRNRPIEDQELCLRRGCVWRTPESAESPREIEIAIDHAHLGYGSWLANSLSPLWWRQLGENTTTLKARGRRGEGCWCLHGYWVRTYIFGRDFALLGRSRCSGDLSTHLVSERMWGDLGDSFSVWGSSTELLLTALRNGVFEQIGDAAFFAAMASVTPSTNIGMNPRHVVYVGPGVYSAETGTAFHNFPTMDGTDIEEWDPRMCLSRSNQPIMDRELCLFRGCVWRVWHQVAVDWAGVEGPDGVGISCMCPHGR